MKRFTLLTVFAAILFTGGAIAQSTWQDIYLILRGSCGTSSCHGSGSSNENWNVDTAITDLYSQLINGDPKNPWAKDSLGHKYIKPGSPAESFLMRKLAHCDPGLPMSLRLLFIGNDTITVEGAPMPEDLPKLGDDTLQLIFNWILAGAPDTGVVSNPSVVICDFGVGINNVRLFAGNFSINPNPFTDVLTVDYSLEHPGNVKLELFDMQGRSVKTLLEQNITSGNWQNDFQLNLEKGVYFLKLTYEGKYSVTEKVVKM